MKDVVVYYSGDLDLLVVVRHGLFQVFKADLGAGVGQAGSFVGVAVAVVVSSVDQGVYLAVLQFLPR